MTPTKPPPTGWPRITSAVFYDDAATAIDWLCGVFGFEVRLRVESAGGHVEHSELTFGEGVIMVGQSGGKSTRPEPLPCVSPRAVGGINTQALTVCVDDVDRHHAAALAAGATIIDPPSTADYGLGYWVDRTYRAIDLEGHQWWFMQRLRDASPRGS